MSSRREIAITIKGNVGGSKKTSSIYSGNISSAVSSDDSTREAMSVYTDAGDIDGKGNFKGAALAIGLYALNEVKNNVIQSASMEWNRFVDMKEDYLAQNNMNEIKAKLGAVKSYASSAMTGARIGASVGGPVGAVVGAVVGVSGNVYNRFNNFRNAMAGYHEQNNAMNAQTNFSRVRMGLMDGGRGTEN